MRKYLVKIYSDYLAQAQQRWNCPFSNSTFLPNLSNRSTKNYFQKFKSFWLFLDNKLCLLFKSLRIYFFSVIFTIKFDLHVKSSVVGLHDQVTTKPHEIIKKCVQIFNVEKKRFILWFVVNGITFQPHFNFYFYCFADRRTLKILNVKCNPTNKKILT